MKLLIEVTVRKSAGKACEPEDVFAAIEETIDGLTLYPQSPEADEESDYEVTVVRLLNSKEEFTAEVGSG